MYVRVFVCVDALRNCTYAQLYIYMYIDCIHILTD